MVQFLEFLLAGVVLCLLLSQLPASARADDFSFTGTDRAWVQIQENTDTLLLPVYENDMQDNKHDHGVKLLRAAPDGDWTIETHLIDDHIIGTKGLHGGLIVFASAEDFLIFGLQGQRKVALYAVSGGEETKASVMGKDNYFRIEKRDNTYSFFSSIDGESWNAFKCGFTDESGVLEAAKIGIINRWMYELDVFHSSNSRARVSPVEYEYFSVNNERAPFSLNNDLGWSYYKSAGVYPLTAAPNSKTMLLRQARASEWTIEGQVIYSNGSKQDRAGIVLYKDEENYLTFCLCGDYTGKTDYVVSGMIGGEKLEDLFTFSCRGIETRWPRIVRRIQEGEPDRYFFYLYENVYLGCFEDTLGIFAEGARYGLFLQENDGDKPLAAEWEYFDEVELSGYIGQFIEPMDGMWTPQDTEQISVTGNSFASAAGKTGFLLRTVGLKVDWQLDTILGNVSAGSHAGLGLANGENELLYGLRNGKLVTHICIDGETQELTSNAFATYIRLVKEGNTYVMCYSIDQLTWQEAHHWTDINAVFSKARYGLAVRGDTCSFEYYLEYPRPAGRLGQIKGITFVSQLSGEAGINKTQSRWQFGSGDLGSIFTLKDKVFMAFGDSFEGNDQTGGWYKNVLAIGHCDNPAQGIVYDNVKCSLVESSVEYGGAMIPSCGYATDKDGIEKIYIWFHEIYSWNGSNDHRDIAGMGWAVSEDGGNNWHYNRLFSGDMPFQYVACQKEGEDLYLLGNIGCGHSETYLMKVPEASILDVSAYLFWTGNDEKGEPMWSSMPENRMPLIKQPQRELGIVYNHFLGRYLLTGYDTLTGGCEIIQEAEHLWGPWTNPTLLITSNIGTGSAVYGAFSTPSMVENKGESMYFTLTKWHPYNVFWIRTDFEKRDEN